VVREGKLGIDADAGKGGGVSVGSGGRGGISAKSLVRFDSAN